MILQTTDSVSDPQWLRLLHKLGVEQGQTAQLHSDPRSESKSSLLPKLSTSTSIKYLALTSMKLVRVCTVSGHYIRGLPTLSRSLSIGQSG